MKAFDLKPEELVAASIDGAGNMSDDQGGAPALLRQYSSDLLYVHCQSHLLQLALVRACEPAIPMKRVLSAVTKLYALFAHSPKRVSILRATQVAIDNTSHKLVHPGQTRWLSYDGSIDVIVKHYATICLALESICV